MSWAMRRLLLLGRSWAGLGLVRAARIAATCGSNLRGHSLAGGHCVESGKIIAGRSSGTLAIAKRIEVVEERGVGVPVGCRCGVLWGGSSKRPVIRHGLIKIPRRP